jgi:Flp pilus assembly pilin Flp
MKVVFQRLWREQQGAIVSAEIMLVASILVIGVIVGLKSVRDSVVTELADVAQAIGNVDQSYWFSGTAGHHAFTGGGQFFDRIDFCDTTCAGDWGNSKCVVICHSAVWLGFGQDGGWAANGGGWAAGGGAAVGGGTVAGGAVAW